jgi:hypothetical protein
MVFTTQSKGKLMQLTEEQIKIAKKAISEKYGLGAIVDLQTYEPEDALKQYQEYIADSTHLQN